MYDSIGYRRIGAVTGKYVAHKPLLKEIHRQSEHLPDKGGAADYGHFTLYFQRVNGGEQERNGLYRRQKGQDGVEQDVQPFVCVLDDIVDEYHGHRGVDYAEKARTY